MPRRRLRDPGPSCRRSQLRHALHQRRQRYILTLSGNGIAYLYDPSADAYVASGCCSPAPIQGYYGVLGAAGGSYFLMDGLIVNSVADDDRRLGQPGRRHYGHPGGPAFQAVAGRRIIVTIVNTGKRNVAALTPLRTDKRSCG